MHIIFDKDDFKSKADGYHLDCFEEILLSSLGGLEDEVFKQADRVTLYIKAVEINDVKGQEIYSIRNP